MSFNGKDASGERISLLNDEETYLLESRRYKAFIPRPSSVQSSTVSSSDELFLTRQNSWGPANESSSPLSPVSNTFYTPQYSSPSLPYQNTPHQPFANPQGRSSPPASAYPPPPPPPPPQLSIIPVNTAYGNSSYPAYPSPTHSSPVIPQHRYIPVAHFSAPSHPSNAHLPAREGREAAREEGKRYPCRLASEYCCDKTFTTSGHASRHSKIHTAEKMVPCSVEGCDRKFTRSDNMKQHMETHKKKKNKSKEASVRKPRSTRTGSRESPYPSHRMDLLAEAAVSQQTERSRR